MEYSHEIILTVGVLFLAALFAGLAGRRIRMPFLLVFLGVGMLAGEDGFGGIVFNDFETAYLVGSIALAAILFEGGMNTKMYMLRQALWPALALGTIGVVVSAGVVGLAGVFLLGLSWPTALLLGAVTVPTDAAAVAVLLKLSGASIPSRVFSALEIESGVNDPMSVFLTVVLVGYITSPATSDWQHAALLLAEEMGGGVAFGFAGGYAMVWCFRRLRADPSMFPVMALGGALTVFGGAQVVGASGFLAVYLAGVIVRNYEHPASEFIGRFFGALGWLAQIVLFLMLGLLVTPHTVPPAILWALVVAVVLIVVGRPAGVFVSLLPFRWTLREIGFISWAGLRGAVPIYLTIIPLLAGVRTESGIFNIVFVVVIVSVIIQGWTLKPAAWILGLRGDGAHGEALEHANKLEVPDATPQKVEV